MLGGLAGVPTRTQTHWHWRRRGRCGSFIFGQVHVTKLRSLLRPPAPIPWSRFIRLALCWLACASLLELGNLALLVDVKPAEVGGVPSGNVAGVLPKVHADGARVAGEAVPWFADVQRADRQARDVLLHFGPVPLHAAGVPTRTTPRCRPEQANRCHVVVGVHRSRGRGVIGGSGATSEVDPMHSLG